MKVKIIALGIFLFVILIIIVVVLLAGSTNRQKTEIVSEEEEPTPATQVEIIEPSRFEVITENLETPWGLAMLPDNTILVTERPGRVRLVAGGGSLQYAPVAVMSQVTEIGEGGLLGIAIHPNFLGNKYVYLYYTYSVPVNRLRSDIFNRVVRMTYEGNRLVNEEIIVDRIPGSQFHNGGRIKFGPDGYLYITTGDAEKEELSQDTNSLAGKILRVTDDGKPVASNPFGNMVYSYGHRNSQGIAWDSFRALWSTEHGRSNPTGFDEINVIYPGSNYGWPIIQGDETGESMVTPVAHSGENITWAPAGASFVGSSLFFGGLRGEALFEAVIQNGRVIDLREYFKGQFGRIRDVIVGNDGMIYMTTSNRDGRGTPKNGDDKIIGVNPQKLRQ